MPPVILSTPVPAKIVSLPANPSKVSFPAPPLIMSFPDVPFMVLAELSPELTNEKFAGSNPWMPFVMSVVTVLNKAISPAKSAGVASLSTP